MNPKQERANRARQNSQKAKWTRVRFRDNRVPETRGIFTARGSMGCWCGEPYGHDWPDKAAGAPHPR